MSIKTSGSRSEKSRAGKRSKGPGSKSKGPGAKSKGPGATSKGPAKSKKAHTAPTSLAPPVGEEQAQMNGKANGINGHQAKVKVEDMMDEGQLTRLAAGVTIDTAGRASAGVRGIFISSASFPHISLATNQNRESCSH
jgi:histone acetyltransferase